MSMRIREHIHAHLGLNSVNADTDEKYHGDARAVTDRSG